MLVAKRCRKCRRVKDIGDFYAHRQMADGHLNQCKGCVKRRVRRRERRLRREDPEWREKERARSREKQRRLGPYNKPDPVKRRARYAVRNAVRDGRLEKPSECPECGGSEAKAQIEAHHKDYSQPLDVTWLCSLCHGEHHQLRAG